MGLSTDKTEKLDKIGFRKMVQRNLDLDGDDDLYWNTMYSELVEFKKKFGHSNVQKRDQNKKLGLFVSNQRARWQNKTLSQWKIDKLMEIEFDFQIFRGPRPTRKQHN